jgi:outer membrane biosynthesis protein TonB
VVAGDEGAEEAVRQAGEEGVTLPTLVHKIAPDYPEMMRMARLEARIVLQAIVNEHGTVEDLKVLQCDGKSLDEPEAREDLLLDSTFCRVFSAAAIAAVDRWRYEPARKDGEPVAVYFTVRVDFELE